jgi:hypothetical protein
VAFVEGAEQRQEPGGSTAVVEHDEKSAVGHEELGPSFENPAAKGTRMSEVE